MDNKMIQPSEGKNIDVNSGHPIVSLKNQLDSVFHNWFSSPPSLLGNFSTFSKGFMPKVDISEGDAEIVINAELPGLEEDDISVSLRDDALRIRGQKRQETERTEEGHYYTERSYGSFERTIPLSDAVNEDAVDAKFSKGVLTIRLPKLEEERRKVRKVSIRSE